MIESAASATSPSTKNHLEVNRNSKRFVFISVGQDMGKKRLVRLSANSVGLSVGHAAVHAP